MRYYTVGEVLKNLRERIDARAGITQKEVAAKLGFSPQYINDVLAGKRPITVSLAGSLGFHKIPERYTRKALETAQ